MDTVTKEIYSEVYSVLKILGKKYIDKIPNSLYNMIQENKLETYNPTYTLETDLNEQNIKRESISMIALMHLNYWCNSENEKNELKKIFKENDGKYKERIREKYNPDNLFNKKNIETEKITENVENTEIIKYKEETFFKRILRKIVNFFKK